MDLCYLFTTCWMQVYKEKQFNYLTKRSYNYLVPSECYLWNFNEIILSTEGKLIFPFLKKIDFK